MQNLKITQTLKIKLLQGNNIETGIPEPIEVTHGIIYVANNTCEKEFHDGVTFPCVPLSIITPSQSDRLDNCAHEHLSNI